MPVKESCERPVTCLPGAADLPRHADLGPKCTWVGCVLGVPRSQFYDADGPGITLDFDPGLPMTVWYGALRFVFKGRSGDRAIYGTSAE